MSRQLLHAGRNRNVHERYMCRRHAPLDAPLPRFWHLSYQALSPCVDEDKTHNIFLASPCRSSSGHVYGGTGNSTC